MLGPVFDYQVSVLGSYLQRASKFWLRLKNAGKLKSVSFSIECIEQNAEKPSRRGRSRVVQFKDVERSKFIAVGGAR